MHGQWAARHDRCAGEYAIIGQVGCIQPADCTNRQILTGWQNQFLNAREGSVLVNSVLDGAAAYLMAANQMPQGVLDILDARRRVFLWTGASKTSGSQYLVAWADVCQTKEKGGLGIRDLHLKNQCFLLKLLHRLHYPRRVSLGAMGKIQPESSTL